MTKRPGTFQVARCKDAVYVRVDGLGTMTNGPTFQGFVDAMRKEGYRSFVVDLSGCRGVDSTFMGILLGATSDCAGGLVVLNAGPHCRKQLASVGLDRLLRFEEHDLDLPRGVQLTELQDAPASSSARLKVIMHAHKELVRFDKRNEAKFGPLLREIVERLGDG